MFKKYTPTQLTKTTQLSRSVKQLTDNVHFAASALSIYVVWIGGIPQSIVYLPHCNKSIGYQFILHSCPTSNRSQQLGAIEKGYCKMCHGQLVARSVTWCQHHVEVQTSQSGATGNVEECSWRFLRRLKTEAWNCWQSIFEVFSQFSWSFVKHREQLAKMH